MIVYTCRYSDVLVDNAKFYTPPVFSAAQGITRDVKRGQMLEAEVEAEAKHFRRGYPG